MTTRIAAACPICGDPGTEPRGLRDHITGEDFAVHRCPRCDVRFIADPPAPDELGHFYENEAGDSMHSGSGRLFDGMRKLAIAKDVRPVLSRLGGRGRIVDYGAGDGAVAAYCASQGYDVHAIDVYPASEWPHAHIPYTQHPLGTEPATLPAGTDAVVMRHVLEHVYNPTELLRSLRGQGVRYVLTVVPNAGSRLSRRLGDAWFYWDPPRHLTFFTARSLREAGERAGWQVCELRSAGIDELVTSAHRALLLRRFAGRKQAAGRVVHATRPKGILAGLSSAASAFVGDGVLHVVYGAEERSA